MQSYNLAAITDAILRRFPGTRKDEIHFDHEVESPSDHDGRRGTGTWVAFEVKGKQAKTRFLGAAYAWSTPGGAGERVDLFDRKALGEAAPGADLLWAPRF